MVTSGRKRVNGVSAIAVVSGSPIWAICGTSTGPVLTPAASATAAVGAENNVSVKPWPSTKLVCTRSGKVSTNGITVKVALVAPAI